MIEMAELASRDRPQSPGRSLSIGEAVEASSHAALNLTLDSQRRLCVSGRVNPWIALQRDGR